MRKFFNTNWNETVFGSFLKWGGAFWETPMRLDTMTDVPVESDLRAQTASREQAAPASAIYTVHNDPQLRSAYMADESLPVPHRASA